MKGHSRGVNACVATVYRHSVCAFTTSLPTIVLTGALYVEHLGCDAVHPHVLDRRSGWNW